MTIMWPFPEDGTTETHLRNVNADSEVWRRWKLHRLSDEAWAKWEVAYAEVLSTGPWTRTDRFAHEAGWREEREFYAQVPLTDQDRGLVWWVLLGGQRSFPELIEALDGALCRRQARRALQSLMSRGLARSLLRPGGPRPLGRVAKRPDCVYQQVWPAAQPKERDLRSAR